MEKNIENAVGITGYIVSEVEKIDNIYGQKYEGYSVIVTSERHSGIMDDAVVIMPANTNLDHMVIGMPVMVVGKMQTFKNFETGKVLVYVLADYAEPITGEFWERQNDVVLRGKLGRGITYRETPKGKRITDIMVVVPNLIKGNYCYVPCICWQDEADEVKDWTEGTEVELKGRLQSRKYTKRIDDDTEEQRTCYEVSVSTINKISEV